MKGHYLLINVQAAYVPTQAVSFDCFTCGRRQCAWYQPECRACREAKGKA